MLSQKLLKRINPHSLLQGTTAYIIPDDLSEINSVQVSMLRGRTVLITKEESKVGGKNIYFVSEDANSLYLQKYCSDSDAKFGVYVSNSSPRECAAPTIRMTTYDYDKEHLKIGNFIMTHDVRRIKEIHNKDDKFSITYTDDSKFYGVSEHLPIIIELESLHD
jgi:hypothetical protein